MRQKTTMSQLEFCIDWLNYTAKHNDTRKTIYDVPKGINSPRWIDAIAVHGYQLAIENRFGARVMWHTRRADMGIHVMYSGGTLNAYAGELISAIDIIRHHAFYGDVCKRVDLAIDVMDSDLDLQRLAKMLKQFIFGITTARSWNVISGSQGDTLYIGNRTSEQFMRIYDKGKQMKTDMNWKRIEIELKGSRAVQAARDLAGMTETQAGDYTKAIIKGYADFPDDTWRAIVGDLVIMLGKSKDETPDTYKWLITQVAPAMARYMNDTGDATVIEKFLAVVHSLTDVDQLTNK